MAIGDGAFRRVTPRDFVRGFETWVETGAEMRVETWAAMEAETGHPARGLGSLDVPMTDWRLRIESAQSARAVDVAEGAVLWRDAGVGHIVASAGATPRRFIEIERT
ncbi:cupin [Rhizobium sp. DKSPLA3]|uniref:Cupin n=1 Tax=Rhizobium quercicola TaxID=2901226 RepID=A0A9X1NXA1_9HYPH|nr:cupin [Rhizobium quercicola]MCD7110973.1 cupin [Rhizobium quercicola]